jgi:phage shock protein A
VSLIRVVLVSFRYYLLLDKNSETFRIKEITDKITTMEKKVTQLEEQNRELRKQLEYNRDKEAALHKVVHNYDNLLKKVIDEKNMKWQQDEHSWRIANLESAFYDLLEKYERAKYLVKGFQKNEAVLKKQVQEYENMLDTVKVKFSAYKSISEESTEIKRRLVVDKTKQGAVGKRRRLVTTI